MELQGVTALVTGAARRVGRAIALGLAAAGSNLVIHYNSSQDAAEETAAEARKLGVEVILVQGDLARDAHDILDASTKLAPVRILINSAAVFPDDSLLEVSPDGFNRTLSINLVAPVFVTQAFANALPADETGAVVNISDWRVGRPYPDHFSYTVSKGALDTFTAAAAEVLAPRIRVNAVALGAILPPPGRDSAYLKELAQEIPVQHVGGTEPVVGAVLGLLTNDFMTGETVRVDGGAHLR